MTIEIKVKETGEGRKMQDPFSGEWYVVKKEDENEKRKKTDYKIDNLSSKNILILFKEP